MMVNVREIIPFYDRTIQVSELSYLPREIIINHIVNVPYYLPMIIQILIVSQL